MSSFVIDVLTPDKVLYQGRATALTVKAVDGEVQVLANHAPYLTMLEAGELRLYTEDNTCLHFKHNGGVVEVAMVKVSVLVS
jgi:F-type H+-transporting ATPase subunit epsilon